MGGSPLSTKTFNYGPIPGGGAIMIGFIVVSAIAGLAILDREEYT